MFHLIPAVKHIETSDRRFSANGVCFHEAYPDSRISGALKKLPFDPQGASLKIEILGESGENYELRLEENAIEIKAGGPAGAFYAIQTLRQIFTHEEIPCLYIKDEPDFSYRGFYHDVTRGKVPTVETLKKLIEDMAYYKLNSLQLYVEHTFEFEECKNLIEKTGYLSKDEIHELDAFCQANFIDFIPSLSTFGHLYELLETEEYKHLRVMKDFEPSPNFWHERMAHHTLDPQNPDSIKVVKSLIDQFKPHFTSKTFNICCDETFDLQSCLPVEEAGKLYLDFIKQIFELLPDKKIMMWADVLQEYPEAINEIPEDICFLQWDYEALPSEERIARLAKLNRKMIVCPGTCTWSRLCEDVKKEESNISLMTEYGRKYGALGVLNTNWGDWGNPCSLDLTMYGLVLGAAKSWCADTPISEDLYASVNHLVYKNENGMELLMDLSNLHSLIRWQHTFVSTYCKYRYDYNYEYHIAITEDAVAQIQKDYLVLKEKLESCDWTYGDYKAEMLVSAEGVCLMAELYAKMNGIHVERVTSADKWVEAYSELWLAKNKPQELEYIRDMFLYVEHN